MLKQISIVIPFKIEQAKTHIWMQKRLTEPFLGLWEFPGGKVESNETPVEAAIREVKEETKVTLAKNDLMLFTILHTYPSTNKVIVLNVFLTNKLDLFKEKSRFELNEFVSRHDFNQLIPQPNLKIFKMLQEWEF